MPVFVRPLVKTVAFQVTFPALFSLEGRIGEFQTSIMRDFPESALLVKHQIMIVNRVEGANETPQAPSQTQSVWQFKSPIGVTVDVSRDSLSISSESHKTYAQDGHERFREQIEKVCGSFFKLVPVPLIHRIGLRYINECPISVKTNAQYRRYYNGALPIDRFPLEEANISEVTVVSQRGDSLIRYGEKFVVTDDSGLKLTLDLDASAQRIDSKDIVTRADALHDIIDNEFNAFATADLLAYMRDSDVESP
jgi:uncharacterized protein (TIGR04255 family)